MSIVAAGLFSSCSTNMYVPNTVNAPLLKEKGEIKASLDESNLQLAVAVTDHVGIIANGFYKTYEGKEYYSHSGHMGELGFGYFSPLKNNLVFETYVGGGMGSVSKKVTYTNSDNAEITNSFSAKGARAFIQPGIGYSNKYFDAAFTPRFTFVKYTRFSSTGFGEDELSGDYLDKGRILNGFYTFAEPAFTVRLGYKYLKLQGQYGLTMKLGGGNLRYQSMFGSLGIVLDIARWYNKPVKRK
ncbi:MAG: hypothetical protein JWO44_916 [Bacteroidetes bacterium]|nr:hypothetical protein [Bacteroidota bacterium]